MTTSQSPNFSDRLVTILNHSALNLALAIGYRAGIFDYLDQQEAPTSLTQLANGSGLHERYLKEWLGVMVCGEIIELHTAPDEADRFSLPKNHADLLCRRAGGNNLGVYTQEMPLLTTCALEPLMADLRSAKGISYDHYPRFQSFMAQLADAKHREVLVDIFLPSVAGGRIIAQLREGIRVCDLGCGTGLAVCLMAAAYPASEFVGFDIDPQALEEGRRAADESGLQNVRFECADAAALVSQAAYKQSFHYITAFDAIHDQTRPLEALQSVRAMLTPEGAFSMVDIAADSELAENVSHPMGAFLYAVSLMHCLPVGLVSEGAGLGMMWGRQRALGMLEQAGFSKTSVEEIPNDPFNLHFYCLP
jgi:ubiquinone/menaquinone biosynthesis C-methylase UbiE